MQRKNSLQLPWNRTRRSLNSTIKFLPYRPWLASKVRIRSRCFRHCYCHGSIISCQWNDTQTSILYSKMLGWWREWERKTPYIFHIRTSQHTIRAVAPVEWPPWVQVQAKTHLEIVLLEVFLADKDPITTQQLQSLLDRLDNGTNHKQTLRNWQTLTVRHCQSRDAAGVVVDQVTVKQTLYVQIRKNKETERKNWMPRVKRMQHKKNTCHWKNWKKSNPWRKLPSRTIYKGCCL